MERPQPLISIIVPVYKTEKYLCKCVDSILAQTYTNLEVILVDDGSPDNCGKICDEYAAKDSRIKVIHQENGGLSAARNAGLDIATGDYIGFVDSDDYISPQMYMLLYDSIISSNSDVSICNYEFVNESFPLGVFSPIKDCVVGSDEVIGNLYDEYYCYYVTVWNRLYRSIIFSDLRFDVGKKYEDAFIAHKIFSKCEKISIISKKLYFYLKRDDSITGDQFSVSKCDELEALYRRLVFIRNTEIIVDEKKASRQFIEIFKQFKKGFSPKTSDDKQRVKQTDKYAKWVYKEYKKYCTKKERIIFSCLSVYPHIAKAKKSVLDWFTIQLFVFKQLNAKYILLNLPVYCNYGDQAIALSEIQFFKKLNVRFAVLNEDVTDTVGDKIYKCIGKNKTVVICGGGFMGGLWTEAEKKYIQQPIKALPDNRIIIFPQTVTFDLDSEYGKQFFEYEKSVYSSHKKLTVFVREQKSFDFMKQYMPEVNTRFAPDMVLGLDLPFGGLERNGVLFCMRNDREKAVDSVDALKNAVLQKYPDMEQTFVENSVCKLIEPENREKETFEQIKKFASSKLVVTDRLHGMIFAAITSTPCIAFNNSNGKVAGVYEWIKENSFIKLCNSADEAIKALDDLNLNAEYHFDKAKCDSAFLPLIEALNGKNGT